MVLKGLLSIYGLGAHLSASHFPRAAHLLVPVTSRAFPRMIRRIPHGFLYCRVASSVPPPEEEVLYVVGSTEHPVTVLSTPRHRRISIRRVTQFIAVCRRSK